MLKESPGIAKVLFCTDVWVYAALVGHIGLGPPRCLPGSSGCVLFSTRTRGEFGLLGFAYRVSGAFCVVGNWPWKQTVAF